MMQCLLVVGSYFRVGLLREILTPVLPKEVGVYGPVLPKEVGVYGSVLPKEVGVYGISPYCNTLFEQSGFSNPRLIKQEN